jgi:arylsulfatase
MYGVIDDVASFAATFDEYPPRQIPPSFNPANILEAKLRRIKAERALKEILPLPAGAEAQK